MPRNAKKGTIGSLPPSPKYEIGYGKPPVHSRFQPGRSGNPAGRPQGARRKSRDNLYEERLKTIVLQEAYRTIRINDAKGEISVPIAQAVMRSLAVNAAKGNQRAQRLFTELLMSVERDNKRIHEEWLETAIEYKVQWDKELQRRQRLGIDAPAPIPHPDHVVIDLEKGGVRITGPMTKQEKLEWDRLEARKLECEAAIAELERVLGEEADASSRDELLSALRCERQWLAMIARILQG